MFYISRESWDKIINYARAREEQKGHEIGGMAVIIKDDDGDYIIQEPVILKQTTSAATCTMDKEALANYYVEMGMKYGSDVHFLWWHSHAKMKAFWSGTDTNTMEEYNNGKWSAFLVVNVRQEHKFSIKYWDPVPTLVDDQLTFLDEEDDAIDDTIMKEVESICDDEVETINTGWGKAYTQSGWNRPYGQGYMWPHENNQTKKDDDSLDVNDIITYADKLIDSYCNGSIKKREWNKKVKKYNTLLETAKAEYRIKNIGSKELEDAMYYIHGQDLVVDLNGESLSEMEYNLSFIGGTD
jgi:proteasome lid subunit RPN8/RPN11